MRYRFLNASICATAILDIVLTGIFFHQRLRSKSNNTITSVAGLNQASTEPIVAKKPSTSSDVNAAMFLLLRQPTPGAQPYVCPSDNAGKWDYSGISNWTNSTQPGNAASALGRGFHLRVENLDVHGDPLKP
jgi:hypothetical protein